MITRPSSSLLQIFLVLVLVSTLSCTWSGGMSSFLASLSLPEETHQLLLVRTPSWDAVQGKMELYVRSSGSWVREEDDIPVVLGRNGLAWGIGLQEENLPGPQKMEGDGKAPAGLFRLGPSFGYDGKPPSGSIYPYQSVTDNDYFIDDVNSPDYNQWISLADSIEKEPVKHWKSFERMKRDDDLYELGIVVEHNMHPVHNGKGSAIFVHVWRGPDKPTAGCTTMSSLDMQRLLRWLDPSQKPLLLQLPGEVASRLRLRHPAAKN
jgi:L,D-peptidoglycan transpeptidase YkuD (ErfK/YbiS/YcfS/YnhG family)